MPWPTHVLVCGGGGRQVLMEMIGIRVVPSRVLRYVLSWVARPLHRKVHLATQQLAPHVHSFALLGRLVAVCNILSLECTHLPPKRPRPKSCARRRQHHSEALQPARRSVLVLHAGSVLAGDCRPFCSPSWRYKTPVIQSSLSTSHAHRLLNWASQVGACNSNRRVVHVTTAVPGCGQRNACHDSCVVNSFVGIQRSSPALNNA